MIEGILIYTQIRHGFLQLSETRFPSTTIPSYKYNEIMIGNECLTTEQCIAHFLHIFVCFLFSFLRHFFLIYVNICINIQCILTKKEEIVSYKLFNINLYSIYGLKRCKRMHTFSNVQPYVYVPPIPVLVNSAKQT